MTVESMTCHAILHLLVYKLSHYSHSISYVPDISRVWRAELFRVLQGTEECKSKCIF